jgi:prepilin peptidase CpaA
VWVAAVALSDLNTRKIPNALVVAGGLLGLAIALHSGTILDSIAGIGAAFAIGIVPFALRALGAGDVKASMTVGSFVGALGVVKIILATALLSGAIAWLWWTVQRFRPSEHPSTIPVGVPLALSTWALTAGFWLN